MKYCKNCNCNVNEKLDNCPVCGSYVNDNARTVCLDNYEQTEYAVNYPKIKNTVDAKPKIIINLLVMLAGFLCLAINLVTNNENLWSIYVLFATFGTVTCVISPIFDKKKVYLQIGFDVLFICGGLLLFDFFTNGKFGNFHGWSIEFVIPSVLLACILVVNFLIIFRGKRNKGFFLTLYYLCAISLVPQIVLWAIKQDLFNAFCLALFFVAIANALIISIVCYKSVKEEFGKKFNI